MRQFTRFPATCLQWRAIFTFYLPTILFGMFDTVKVARESVNGRKDLAVPNTMRKPLTVLFLLLGRIVQLVSVRAIHVNTAEYVHKLILRYVLLYSAVFGPSKVKPNHHRALHILWSIVRFGPVYAFWAFAFERYNGMLGATPSNNREVELTFSKIFFTRNLLYDLNNIVLNDWVRDGSPSVPVITVQQVFENELQDNERDLLAALKPVNNPIVSATAAGHHYFALSLPVNGVVNPLRDEVPEDVFLTISNEWTQAYARYEEDLRHWDAFQKRVADLKANVQRLDRLCQLAYHDPNVQEIRNELSAARNALQKSQDQHRNRAVPVEPEHFAVRLAECFHPFAGHVVERNPRPVIWPKARLDRAAPAFMVHNASSSVCLVANDRLDHKPIISGSMVTRKQLRNWLQEYFQRPPADVELDRHSSRCTDLDGNVVVHHTVSFANERFDSQAAHANTRAHILIYSHALAEFVKSAIPNHDVQSTFPTMAVERILFPARVEFFVTVKYSTNNGDESTTFAVCQFYKYDPRRLDWDWGALAELYRDEFWPLVQIQQLGLVPVAHIAGKFVKGPPPPDPAFTKTFSVNRLTPRIVV